MALEAAAGKVVALDEAEACGADKNLFHRLLPARLSVVGVRHESAQIRQAVKIRFITQGAHVPLETAFNSASASIAPTRYGGSSHASG